jgi:decaprenyl-phosphate phosphoribosyltransferase
MTSTDSSTARADEVPADDSGPKVPAANGASPAEPGTTGSDAEPTAKSDAEPAAKPDAEPAAGTDAKADAGPDAEPDVAPSTEADMAGPTGDESAPPAAPAPPERGPGGVAAGVLRTMRPRQWVKNVLVLAAPFAAGDIFMPGIALDLLIAFVAFSIAASGIYLVNDANDVAADRAHPTKRNRPIAAGIVPVPVALGVAVVLLLGALALSAVASYELLAVLAVYVVVQLSYCFWLKHQPVLDICIVASGFLLRAVAGGAATGIPLSQWFLLSAGFGSLFMVAGKRYAEMMLAERTGAKIRKSLESYSASYLRFVWALSATVLITTYCLWAFAIGEQQHNMVYSAISIVPFVVAVLRYSVDVDGGNGGEPEEIALGDRVLQVLAVLWIATLTAAVYF